MPGLGKYYFNSLGRVVCSQRRFIFACRIFPPSCSIIKFVHRSSRRSVAHGYPWKRPIGPDNFTLDMRQVDLTDPRSSFTRPLDGHPVAKCARGFLRGLECGLSLWPALRLASRTRGKYIGLRVPSPRKLWFLSIDATGKSSFSPANKGCDRCLCC